MKIWLMFVACWVTKATNIHTEYVILIVFPLQQWLLKLPSMLCYTHIPFIVEYYIKSPLNLRVNVLIMPSTIP